VCVFVKNDEPDAEPFYFDEVLNPISAYKSEQSKGMSEETLDDEDFEFELPADVAAPLCDSHPLYTQRTNSGINLYWAPRPFNMRSGKTR